MPEEKSTPSTPAASPDDGGTPQQKPDERAVEEWKQLSTIIGRFDTLEFQHRGWLLVLVGALIAALYAEKGRLSGGLFGVVASSVWVMFLWMELVSRLTKRKALWRVRTVEAALR